MIRRPQDDFTDQADTLAAHTGQIDIEGLHALTSFTLFTGRDDGFGRAGLDAGTVADAKIGVDGDIALGVPGEGGAAEGFDTGVDPLAHPLVDRHMLLLIGGIFSLLTGELEHAGVPGDHHTEFVDGHRFGHQFGQFGLLVGIHLGDVLDPQPFQHLPDGNLVRHLVEVFPAGRMVLVAGHGGRAVFHENQGDGVAVENGIDDAGQGGMKEGRITHEGDHLAAGVEQAQTAGHGRRCPHAHEQLAHLVWRQKAQGVAADVRHGDIGGGKGLLDGVKGAAVAASRTHLGRPVGRRILRF